MNIQEAFPHIPFLQNEPMSRHTTFRIGGPAQWFVQPRLSELRPLLSYCKEEQIPVTVIGNGSNLLVGDKGIRGLVIALGQKAAELRVEDRCIHAQAGALLSQVAAEALAHSLHGLEFAAGIPGTLGGAVLMNAGAYDGEMRDVLVSVDVLRTDGQIETWQRDELDLSYRHSRMMDEHVIVLSAVMQLEPGDACEMPGRRDELRARRQEQQPLSYPSAGSTFTRPAGHFAGKLIMDAGLAGYQVGGAAVSEKHCGFVINRGDATAADVRQLMEDVTRKVFEQSGVRLEPEVRFVGDF